jgi:RES domain-containing protein
MARRAFRVCRAIYARLDGEGARRVGGRWNSPGRAAIYMAESVSLAVLENLVHMSRGDFPIGYVVASALIPDHVPVLTYRDLVARWGQHKCRVPGDQWLLTNASPILRVPSAVVPAEQIYVMNPGHSQFAEIVVETPIPFHFDRRLFDP